MKTPFKISLVAITLSVIISSCGLTRNAAYEPANECTNEHADYLRSDESPGLSEKIWVPAADRSSALTVSENEIATNGSIKSEKGELSRSDAKKSLISEEQGKTKRKSFTKSLLTVVKDQKKNNSNGWGFGTADVLLIILAIFLPWLSVGIYTGWDVKLTVITVLLWILGWLPGVIFGMLVLFDVVG